MVIFYSYVKVPGGVYIYIIFILVVWNIWIIFHTLGIVIPIDFHIFQRGRYTTNQIYIYICVWAFHLFNIYGMISKQMIQYKLYILLIDFFWFRWIWNYWRKLFFLGIWICCCHPGFTLCILQRGQLTPSIQLICCMGLYVYIYIIHIYIYIWKWLIPLLAMVFTIGFNGLYPPIAISRHCESWKSVIRRLKSWL